MRCASRSAPVPKPGKFFGQVVTIFSSSRPCEIAGFGKLEAATAPTTAALAAVLVLFKKSRRFISILPFVVGRLMLPTVGQLTVTIAGNLAMPVGPGSVCAPPIRLVYRHIAVIRNDATKR